MRILHVITTINLGGAENHLYDLVKDQVESGLKVQVVYLKGDHFWKKKYEELNVETHCLEIHSYILLFKFFLLRSLLKKINPDVVHVHMPPAELVTRLALYGFSYPLVISKHNAEPFAPFFKNRILANWVAHRASKIICISNAVQKYVADWSRKTCKLVRIYYSVDYQKFSGAQSTNEFRGLQNSFVMGTVSRLTPQKSLDTLLQAFSLFVKIHENAKLVMVGIGELEEELKSLAKKIGIADKVIWAGKRSDIPAVMKSFDLFLLTSKYEGFGLVLLEAMAAGVPIIASNISAIPEVLDHGRCGILFESQNVECLFQAMQKAKDSDLRKELVIAGKDRAKNFFSREIVLNSTTAIYREVIDS